MKNLFFKYFLAFSFLPYDAMAKEIFTLEAIESYLTQENPYVYSAIGQQYVDEARIGTAQGELDTILSSEYDKKEYPASQGEFADISLSKPTENGTEFILGYRRAQGVQEYNNIKTSTQGEHRIGVKVPVFALLKGMNKRKYSINSAEINANTSTFEAQNNLRNLYATIGNAYYQLLYFNELLKFEHQLLEKAQKRDQFIKNRVNSGDLPEMAMLESKQQIISREQRIVSTQNQHYTSLQSCLKYMNISKQQFDSSYTLPSLEHLKQEKLIPQEMIESALEKRPDLKALEYQKVKLDLDAKYNDLSAYPTVNLFAYGVHDLYYGEGTKVGMNLEIPLERRGYKGKKVEIQKGLDHIHERQNQLKLELKANVHQLINSLDSLKQNITLGEKEIAIVEELETIENKKYTIGSSNLFQLNQREIAVLEIHQKQLEYTINTLLIQQELQREMGEFSKL